MEEQHYYDPPRWAAVLLGWLLKDEWGTPLGDYEEYYNDLAARQGERKAQWWYRGQVMRLLPDRLFEKIYWGNAMLKSYFLLGFRNLLRDKVAASINIVGLSIAVGFCIAVFLLLQMINTYDDFHENGDHIFLVGHSVERFGDLERWGTSPVPLGPALAADFSQIERAVRFESQRATVRASGSAFSERVSFADVGFFDLLTFPLQQGQTSALEDPTAVIISADMAAKYFRDQDPMGQQLMITFTNGSEEPLIVRGVAKAFPHSASLRFDFLLGYEKWINAGLTSLEDWSAFTKATFIQLAEPQDIALIADQLNRYVRPQNEANELWQVRSFFFDNIQNPDWDAWEITRRAMRAPEPLAIVVFGLIAGLMLAVACFNYIIISLGSAARRLKEIGIRKTAGAEKMQLVMQFLTENLLLCFLALLIGGAFALGVVIPLFNNVFGYQIPLDFMGNLGFWIFLIGLLAFIGLVSGAYPAFYISSFQPVAILQGRRTLAEKKGLTHVLATIQFMLAIITISICTFFFSLNQFLEDLAWGYNAEQTLVIPNINHEQYTILGSEALQIPQVLQVAGAQNHIGGVRNQVTIQVEGTEKQAAFYSIGPSYLASIGLGVHAGRTFEERFAGDGSNAVVINKTFAEAQGWANAIGQSLRYENQAYSVVGVVEDFLIGPFLGKSLPAFFALSDEDEYRYLIFRVEAGAQDQVAASLRAIWERQFPEVSFEYFPQTAVFERYHVALGKFTRNVGYLAFFALLVSCMGLFGMASQRAARRMTEMGIRKVLGASAVQVIFLVNRGFLIIIGIAALMATPLCYFGLYTLLSFAPVEVPLGPGPFIVSNILVFLMAAFSLSMQTNKLVTVNPAEVLRHE